MVCCNSYLGLAEEFFIRLYPFRDGSQQLSILNRPIYNIRIHGFAQHGTAVGGIATFGAVFSYSIKKYYKQHIGLCNATIILSIITIFFSQGRAGMLAFAAVVFAFFVIDMILTRRIISSIMKIFLIIITFLVILFILYKLENAFVVSIVNKWGRLFSDPGSGRVEYLLYFIREMNPIDWIFGLSRQVINKTDVSWGIEIEPLNILITYGISGFILQYGLILLLLVYFFRKLRDKLNSSESTQSLLIASFVGLFGYQVFSVGYFFFREIQVGLFIWIVMGVAIGSYESEKKKMNLQTNNDVILIKEDLG